MHNHCEMDYNKFKNLSANEKIDIKFSIIALYKDREPLWNIKLRLHSNRIYRNENIMEIGTKLGLEGLN